MFDGASYDDWTDVHKTNTFAIYFVTMAFLGLLVKGGEETSGFSSCVVNITSVAGVAKLAQCHVSDEANRALLSFFENVIYDHSPIHILVKF